MRLSDFDFNLPNELIAHYPSEQRVMCKLLCLDGNTGELKDKIFKDILDELQEGDLLVFNDTKVIAARLFGRKASGGHIEILIERLISDHQALCHIRASKSPKEDSLLYVDDHYELKVLGREGALFMLELQNSDTTILSMLDAVGHIPLPPYIEREDEPLDRIRYQTVYSKHEGAVAAPTAGLHFDQELLDDLRKKKVDMAFVTLHVGAGTFQPVRVERIEDHVMHKEFVQLSQEVADKVIKAKQKGHRVIAVGTTAVRSLESAAQYAKQHNKGIICSYEQDTNIFIYPGYQYQIVDALITNFHLPQSTLIMLVAAFCGYKNTLHAYNYAVAHAYKFFSYGDAMFISKRQIMDDLVEGV